MHKVGINQMMFLNERISDEAEGLPRSELRRRIVFVENSRSHEDSDTVDSHEAFLVGVRDPISNSAVFHRVPHAHPCHGQRYTCLDFRILKILSRTVARQRRNQQIAFSFGSRVMKIYSRVPTHGKAKRPFSGRNWVTLKVRVSQRNASGKNCGV